MGVPIAIINAVTHVPMDGWGVEWVAMWRMGKFPQLMAPLRGRSSAPEILGNMAQQNVCAYDRPERQMWG